MDEGLRRKKGKEEEEEAERMEQIVRIMVVIGRAGSQRNVNSTRPGWVVGGKRKEDERGKTRE